MARRKKRKPSPDSATSDSAPPKVPRASTPLGELFEQAGLSRLPNEESRNPPTGTATGGKAPREQSEAPREQSKALGKPRSTADLAAWNAAYRDVQPIRRPKRGRPQPTQRAPAQQPPGDPQEEQAMRARLSGLVSDGLRFFVEWSDELVQGVREGVADSELRRLSGHGFQPEATLDLHGCTRSEVPMLIDRFVRSQCARGRRFLLIVVGKGLHSEDGHGVLAEAAVHALVRGGAAPRVLAFCSAHPRHGGSGALAVFAR